MPVSNRELQALEIIFRYGGHTGYSTVAQAMRVGSEYAKTICRGLGQTDCIDMTLSGLCKITPKGIEELLRRGSITPADLEPADEEAESPQAAEGSWSPRDWPEAPRREVSRSAAAPARAPSNRVDLKCAYCYGRGTDPFGVPSPSSKCAVCGGKGYNGVVAPYATCAACGGTGKLAGRRMTCTTCKGKGVMTVRPGTGRQFRSSVGAAAPTMPGAIQRGQLAPVSLARAAQSVSVADQVATHITTFPGAEVMHMETLFGLSGGEAERMLQELVQARRIRLAEDGLYYPA